MWLSTPHIWNRYHEERNHQGLENRLITPTSPISMTTGTIQRRERLGGPMNCTQEESERELEVYRKLEAEAPSESHRQPERDIHRDGAFTDITKAAGVYRTDGNGLGVVFGDYDDDGWTDIYVANDSVPNFLFHNKGNGVFEEVGFRAGVSVGGVMQRPNDAPSEKTVAQINIVLNWFEELKERVPVR